MKKMVMAAGVMGMLVTSTVGAQISFLEAGHGDIGVAYEGGSFAPHWHIGAGAVVNGMTLDSEEEFEPESLIVLVKNVPVPRPAAAAYDPIGIGAGERFWRLPMSGAGDEPELGIATEELFFEDWLGQISFTLVDFSGPGQFSLYRVNAGTPVFFMATSDGLSADDRVQIMAEAHSHYTWAFTAPGYYELTLLVEGLHAVDGVIRAEARFGFYVVPEPRVVMLFGMGIVLWAWKARRRF